MELHSGFPVEYDLKRAHQAHYARIMDEIEAEDRVYEIMCDWYDQQKEANLVNWGVENLDEVGHDQ